MGRRRDDYDPPWLKLQGNTRRQVIEKWAKKYWILLYGSTLSEREIAQRLGISLKNARDLLAEVDREAQFIHAAISDITADTYRDLLLDTLHRARSVSERVSVLREMREGLAFLKQESEDWVDVIMEDDGREDDEN